MHTPLRNPGPMLVLWPSASSPVAAASIIERALPRPVHLGQDYMNRKAAWYVMGVCNWKSYYVKERGRNEARWKFAVSFSTAAPRPPTLPVASLLSRVPTPFPLSPFARCPEASGRADNRGISRVVRAELRWTDCWSNDNPEINATYIGRAIVDRNNDRGWCSAGKSGKFCVIACRGIGPGIALWIIPSFHAKQWNILS